MNSAPLRPLHLNGFGKTRVEYSTDPPLRCEQALHSTRDKSSIEKKFLGFAQFFSNRACPEAVLCKQKK